MNSFFFFLSASKMLLLKKVTSCARKHLPSLNKSQSPQVLALWWSLVWKCHIWSQPASLKMHRGPRLAHTATASWMHSRNHPEWTERPAKAVSVHPGGSWFFAEDIDLKGLKQSIETFNNIIPEAESEPKKKKTTEWLYLLLREMQLPPWHGYDYKIG